MPGLPLPADPTPEGTAADVTDLLAHMTSPEHRAAAELIRSRYPAHAGSADERNRCLQYELRRHLGWDLPDPPSASSSPFDWPAGTLGAGFMSELARSLCDGDSATFHVRRSGHQLIVTVQPHPYAGEPATTALPVTVLGVPGELDHTLARHLPLYTETRRNVHDTLRQHARLTAQHLSQLDEAATEATGGTGTLDFIFTNGYLNLGACGVRLLSEYGEINTTAAQFPMPLMPGEYTVSIQHAGYSAYTTAARVGRGKTARLKVTLRDENSTARTL